jgi:hypothetical protein
MSTGMIATNQSPAAMMDFVKQLGKDIAVSKMFGAENENQGRVLALACLVRGRDPLSLPLEYHLMGGKLTMRADAMLGRFSSAGGVYEIIEHSPNAAEIKMEFKGRKFHERFTWQEAQQEPFVYEGKGVVKLLQAGKHAELQLKDNYATPRRRMQQLWCRVVSDGVRVIAPELVTGSYSPQETSDYTGLAVPDGAAVTGVVVTELKHRGTEGTEIQQRDAIEDAEVVIKQPEAKPEAKVEQPTVKMMTAEQAKQIEQYFALLGMSQAVIDGCLAKRDATLMADLTFDAAADLLAGLKARHEKHAAANPTESGSIAMNSDGPISQELIDKIVGKFKEVAQSDINIVKQLRSKLEKDGVKISELTHNQGRKLLDALDTKQIKSFFDVVLNKNLTVEPIASDDVPDV